MSKCQQNVNNSLELNVKIWHDISSVKTLLVAIAATLEQAYNIQNLEFLFHCLKRQFLFRFLRNETVLFSVQR